MDIRQIFSLHRAVYAKAVSYNRIKNILENNLDRAAPEEKGTDQSHIPKHENIRGNPITDKYNDYEQ